MVRTFHPSRGLCTLALLLCVSGAPGAPAPLSPAEVFDPGGAHTIDIKMSAEAWDLLEPGAGARKVGGTTNREQARTVGVRLRPNAPAAYAYVLSDMEFDGERIADVGLRF